MPSKNWPHPVLDAQTEDYPNCAFQVTFDVEQTKVDYKVRATFDLGCDSLEESIREQDAQYILHVSCVRTAYRQVFPTSTSALEISIPEHELRDTFTVSPYIVSTKEHRLRSGELSPTFEGLTFSVGPGVVLAAAPSVDFFAEKVFDELKNISAIFQVIKHPDAKSNAVEYDLTGHKITIVLPQRSYDDYRIFRSRKPYREMFVCSLVLPGLMTALDALLGSSGADDEDTLRWRRVLKRKLAELGHHNFSKDDAVKVAQLLLEFPYSRAFQAIRDKESSGD